jgi:hypothetical protein
MAIARTTIVFATAAVRANRGGFKVRYDAASRRPVRQTFIVAQRKTGEPFAEIVDRRFAIRHGNPLNLRECDSAGAVRYWILAIHFIDPDRAFGGFFEALLTIGPA